MAKNDKPAADNAGVAVVTPVHNKKLFLMAFLALIVFSLIGSAVYFFLIKGNLDGEDGEAVTESVPYKPKPAKRKGGNDIAGMYVALEAITVNLSAENGEQFLQLMLSIEMNDAEMGDKVKLHAPKIRNNVMLLLSGKKSSELITKEGKILLASEIRAQINDIIEPGSSIRPNDAPVKAVLFTSFIIQ